MSKKDYERAATIVQGLAGHGWQSRQHILATVTDAFVELFRGDNPRFNEDRFRAACVLGANVRARNYKLVAA